MIVDSDQLEESAELVEAGSIRPMTSQFETLRCGPKDRGTILCVYHDNFKYHVVGIPWTSTMTWEEVVDAAHEDTLNLNDSCYF